MSENNLYELSVYKEKRGLIKALLAGVFSLFFAVDIIFFGYLREIIGQRVLLKDFGQNAKEELFIYTILAIGAYLILYFFMNIKNPIITISDKTITLKTKNQVKSFKGEREDLIYYEFTNHSTVLFYFKKATILVNVDNVKKESLRRALETI